MQAECATKLYALASGSSDAPLISREGWTWMDGATAADHLAAFETLGSLTKWMKRHELLFSQAVDVLTEVLRAKKGEEGEMMEVEPPRVVFEETPKELIVSGNKLVDILDGSEHRITDGDGDKIRIIICADIKGRNSNGTDKFPTATTDANG